MEYTIKCLNDLISYLKDENTRLLEDIDKTEKLIELKKLENEKQWAEICELEESIKILEKKNVNKNKKIK